MLRYSFLPSDFHPQFLFLGERADLHQLASALRDFATKAETIDVAHQSPHEASRDVQAVLTPRSVTEGLHRRDEQPDVFEWRLDPNGASIFADMIEETASAPAPAGSVMLEVGVAGEIPVKVSYGEFTDDFLIEDF